MDDRPHRVDGSGLSALAEPSLVRPSIQGTDRQCFAQEERIRRAGNTQGSALVRGASLGHWEGGLVAEGGFEPPTKGL